MCVACGNIADSAAASNVLTFIVAFSPIFGLYAYRVYTALSVSHQVRQGKNSWFLAVRLALYSISLYVALATIAYALIPYITSWSIIGFLTPVFIALFIIFCAKNITKNQSVLTGSDYIRLSITQLIGFFAIFSVALLIYTDPDPVQPIVYHRWFVQFGIFWSINTAIISAAVFFIALRFFAQRYASAGQLPQRPTNSRE